jgi:hypothetical protein
LNLGASLDLGIWEPRPFTTMLSFPLQVPAITLFNPFYPLPLTATRTPLAPFRSTSFHQKSPVIPHIPPNSTYAVPRNEIFSDALKMLTFPSQIPAITDSNLFFHSITRTPARFPLPFGVHPIGCLHLPTQISDQKSKIRNPNESTFPSHLPAITSSNLPRLISRHKAFIHHFHAVNPCIHDFHAKKFLSPADRRILRIPGIPSKST